MLRIIHFSKTPCAGSTIRLVQCLNKFTDFDVRLVETNRWGLFDSDLIISESPDEICELVEKADIIHIHNYLHYDSKEFHPIDFGNLKKNGKIFIRHLRSDPESISRRAFMSVQELINLDIPSVVVGQFMERFYPKARVVPNIIPENDPLYIPSKQNEGIYYAPTFKHSAWTERWETKAAPEVKMILENLKKNKNAKINTFDIKPLKDALKIKQSSEIVIDDLVTGSYHISSLEGLSMGKPVLTYLDNRTQFVFNELSGSNECPLINTRFEEAYEILAFLLDNKKITNEIGKNSRVWFEKYWSEKILVNHFIKLYEDLLDNPEKICRQENLKIINDRNRFFSVILPDIIYDNRADEYLKRSNFSERLNIRAIKIYFRLKHNVKKLLIRVLNIIKK